PPRPPRPPPRQRSRPSRRVSAPSWPATLGDPGDSRPSRTRRTSERAAYCWPSQTSAATSRSGMPASLSQRDRRDWPPFAPPCRYPGAGRGRREASTMMGLLLLPFLGQQGLGFGSPGGDGLPDGGRPGSAVAALAFGVECTETGALQALAAPVAVAHQGRRRRVLAAAVVGGGRLGALAVLAVGGQPASGQVERAPSLPVRLDTGWAGVKMALMTVNSDNQQGGGQHDRAQSRWSAGLVWRQAAQRVAAGGAGGGGGGRAARAWPAGGAGAAAVGSWCITGLLLGRCDRLPARVRSAPGPLLTRAGRSKGGPRRSMGLSVG